VWENRGNRGLTGLIWEVLLNEGCLSANIPDKVRPGGADVSPNRKKAPSFMFLPVKKPGQNVGIHSSSRTGMVTHVKTFDEPDDNFHGGFHHFLCRYRRMYITGTTFPGPDGITRTR
jgi:hypothetical protein